MGVQRWNDAASLLLLLMVAIGGFPGNVHGVLKEGLYISNKTDILFIFNPESQNAAGVVSVYKQVGRLTGLAYDKCSGQIFWSNVDVVNRGIYRATLNADGKVEADNVTKIIDTDVLEVSGLSYDWVSKHLYWTDSRKKTIEVSDEDGKNRRILMMTGKGSPRGIYADPINGYLFWTDQGQKHIARSNLDGSDQKVIVTDKVNLPNQITVYNGKLYWVDSSSKTFESSNLDGRDRSSTSINGVAKDKHIFGLAIHDNRAYITNWVNGQLIGVDVNTRNVAMGTQNLGKEELFSAIYVKSTHQPNMTDPCATKRCAALCLPVKAQQPRCTCPSYGGKILSNDGMNCVNPTNSILLVAMADTGYVGFYDASDHTKKDFYVVGRSLRPVAVAYDPVDKNVFWSDVRQRSVHVANIDGRNPQILLRNNHGIGLVEGMLVDVTRRQLYYTNIGSVLINGTAYSWHRIETFSLRRLTNVKVKTIVTTADKPRGLALDSANGHLYYTDWGSRASIVRVNLDGSNPTLLRTGLDNPNGIVFLDNKIFFVDSHFKSRQEMNGQKPLKPKNGTLYSMSSDGSALTDILARTGVELRTPFGLTATTTGSHLYVGDWETENLTLLNKDGTLSQTILQGTSGLMSLSYSPFTATAEGTDRCNGKSCGDICVSKTATEASCTCNSYGGKSLVNSGDSCSVPSKLLIVADMNSIKIVSQEDKDSNPYIAVQGNPFMSNFVGLAYDSTKQIVYYSDISGKAISALHLSNMTSVPFYRINEVIDGMVYHEGFLYWTDYTNGRISRLNIRPSLGLELRHEILVRGLSRPRGIRVHDNYVYWTEWGGTPKIQRRNLNAGSRAERMYEKSLNLVWPNGISIFKGKLHVVDGSTKKLYRCELNPDDNCQLISGTEEVLKHAYDLWATDGNVFYYSDWNTGSIKAFAENKPGKTWTIVDGLMRPTQFHFAPLSSRPNCPSGTCSGGACVPLWVNHGCDCGTKVPTYDLKNCTSDSATSCNSGGKSYAPEKSYNPSPCLNCRCLGRTSWANDPVYNDSVCEPISCPKLACESGEIQFPKNQCCPICASCRIRITNCPDKPINYNLPSNQGYVVYDFLPTIKDCFGLAREVSSTRVPTGAIYKRGTTDVVVISTAKDAVPAECRFKVIVKDVTAPTITCPNNVKTYLTGEQTSIDVNWKPPEVIENDELDGQPTASRTWGSPFNQGDHTVTYTATDKSRLTSSCSFNVSVVKLQTTQQGTCKIPQIDNAVLQCSVGSALSCLIERCQQQYRNDIRWNSICSNGNWVPPVIDDLLRKACIKITQTSVIGSLKITAVGVCSAGSDLKYTSEFLYDAINKEHVRRYAELMLAVKAKGCDTTTKDMVVDLDVIGRSYGRDVGNMTSEVNEILNKIRLDLEREFIRVPIDGGTNTAHELLITSTNATSGCLPGEIPKDGECEVCDVGTYHEKVNKTCVRCPPDTYNHLKGQTECMTCPDGAKSGTGSYIVDQCITVSDNFLLMVAVAACFGLLLLLLIVIAIVCVRRRSASKGINDRSNVNPNRVYDPDLDFDCAYDKIADPDKMTDLYDRIADPLPEVPLVKKTSYERLETATGGAAAANTYDTIVCGADAKGKEGACEGDNGDGHSTPPYLEPRGSSTPPYMEPVNA